MKEIALTQGKAALVSDEDYERLSAFNWCAANQGEGRYYAKRGTPSGQTRYMHHAVAGHPVPGMVVDHINGNTLDNTRENLRFITISENAANQHTPVRSKAGVRGVWVKGNRFIARVAIRGKRYYLGSFSSVVDAAAAIAAFRGVDHSPEALLAALAAANARISELEAEVARLAEILREAA